MLERLLTVLFCKRCALCDKVIAQEEELCELCRVKLPRIGSNICPFCGRDRQNCHCGLEHFAFDGAAAPLYYTGQARHLIHQFKYYGQRHLAAPLAQLMAGRVREAFPGERFDLLVPVPMHRLERREREYNHSALLARELSRRLGVPCREKALSKVRETRRQRGLTGAERRQNLRDAFTPGKGVTLAGKTVLLIDDVLTTGSTAEECAKALKSAGAKGVYCVTACATLWEREK
ncbi:ComF family protein [Zongyangia hominis]|uniref:ComF family protein n=1 Tax=Zongyangia hominis TaxID=2763677 RepID=A0A926IC63_9FIRM|nr:ComF family protein [Zongyangia hominis]MBC8570780.1 ComF family protein [Zongyangia hominis]